VKFISSGTSNFQRAIHIAELNMAAIDTLRKLKAESSKLAAQVEDESTAFEWGSAKVLRGTYGSRLDYT